MRTEAEEFSGQRVNGVGFHVASRAEAKLGCRSQVVMVDPSRFPWRARPPGGNDPDRGC